MTLVKDARSAISRFVGKARIDSGKRVQGSAMRKKRARKSALMALVKRKLPLLSNWLAATELHWDRGKAMFVDVRR